MLNRYRLIILTTIVAIFFTSLVYLIPNYSNLWFSLEFIILPIVYIIGYEILMEKQKQEEDNEKNRIYQELNELEKRYLRLKDKKL